MKPKNLVFPDAIDYENSALPNLTKNDVDKSIITNTKKVGHVYKGFEFLDELEEYLFETISSFTTVDEVSDEKLLSIFHNIQIWGGKTGRMIYVTNKQKFPENYKGRFDYNFDLSAYRRLVSRCLNLKKHMLPDWIKTVSDWAFQVNEDLKGFSTSFSTKHIRFWLYNKLQDESLPIFDDIIQSGFNNINTYNLNLRKQTDLEFYWKQMVEKSRRENISLVKLERLLFNYWR